MILDKYGNKLINGTTHVVLLFLEALNYTGSANDITKNIEKFIDILEARGFNINTPLDDIGTTLPIKLAKMKYVKNSTLMAAEGERRRNIYGRSAANYSKITKRQTKMWLRNKSRRNAEAAAAAASAAAAAAAAELGAENNNNNNSNYNNNNNNNYNNNNYNNYNNNNNNNSNYNNNNNNNSSSSGGKRRKITRRKITRRRR